MDDKKFPIVINCIAAAGLFGMWQNNYEAGLFMFSVLGFAAGLVDYAKKV